MEAGKFASEMVRLAKSYEDAKANFDNDVADLQKEYNKKLEAILNTMYHISTTFKMNTNETE